MVLMLSFILAPSVNRKTKEIALERKFKITVDGREYNVTVEDLTDQSSITYSEPANSFPRSAPPVPSFAPGIPAPAHAAVRGPAEAGDIVSTLGGVVESLLVTIGQQVGEGDRVLVIEAMKMKTPVTAHQAGKVAAILVNVGDGVQSGQVLVKLS
jgi:biotin carboxyl carrier protein